MDGLQIDRKENQLRNIAHLSWSGKSEKLDTNKLLEWIRNRKTKINKFESGFESETIYELDLKSKTLKNGGVLIATDEISKSHVKFSYDLYESSLIENIDNMVKLFNPWDLSYGYLSLKFTGFFNGSFSRQNSLFVNIDDYWQWLGIDKKINFFNISFLDSNDGILYKQELTDLLNINLLDWKETHAALWSSLKLEKNMINITMFFVFLLAALTIYMAVSIRISEKSREIALLQVLGMKRNSIVNLYLTEGLLISLFGIVSGALASWFFCNFVLAKGWLHFSEGLNDNIIYTHWSFLKSSVILFISMLIVLIVSWFPVRFIGRKSITKILRF